jgi:hypothetical protein
MPTFQEFLTETAAFVPSNAAGAFASPLKLSLGGYRKEEDGLLYEVGAAGVLWSSTVNGTQALMGAYYSTELNGYPVSRSGGGSIRCIKE